MLPIRKKRLKLPSTKCPSHWQSVLKRFPAEGFTFYNFVGEAAREFDTSVHGDVLYCQSTVQEWLKTLAG